LARVVVLKSLPSGMMRASDRGVPRLGRNAPKSAARWTALRVCDFFDFAQIATLKTKQLTREKVANFQKVTNSQYDTRPNISLDDMYG
jgi:hypothetical protein